MMHGNTKIKDGMVGAWHGHGMASMNQTRPHCVNQTGKTQHSKPLAARHGRGMLCVNRPLNASQQASCQNLSQRKGFEKKAK